jgi:hypothetical protein
VPESEDPEALFAFVAQLQQQYHGYVQQAVKLAQGD